MMSLIPLSIADVSMAGAMMARAFFDEPFALYCLPEAAERDTVLPRHFASLIRFYLQDGEVYRTVDSVDGVCVWEPPVEESMQDTVIPHELATDLRSSLSDEAWDKYVHIIEYLDELRRHEMPDPHWYLSLLAVDPVRHRAGLGSALLKPALDRADHAKKPAYLWTDQPSSVPFYQRQGFSVVSSTIEAQSGVRFWTMRRG